MLSTEALGTANFLLFFDKLFDSVNGSCLDVIGGKVLRTAVKKSTEHETFWVEAIRVLQTIKYIRPDKSEFVPPSIKNWITSVKAFQYLWRKLQEEGFDYMKTRNFNQDPLENFFGNIRSHGIRNVNPTANSFVSSFKTLIINNLSSVHSPGANCEEDDSKSLHILMEFITKDVTRNDESFETFPKIIL